MYAHHPTQSTPLRQCLIAEVPQALATVDEFVVVGAPLGRALAVLALLGAALFLIVAPAVIGSISILDSRLIEQLQRLFGWSEIVRHFVDLGRLAMVFPLAVIVARAGQNA
jgi:hypothetical protein